MFLLSKKILQDMLRENLARVGEKLFPRPTKPLEKEELKSFNHEQALKAETASRRLQEIMKGVDGNGKKTVINADDISLVEHVCGVTMDEFKNSQKQGTGAVVENVFFQKPPDIIGDEGQVREN
jgi:hypothetical protein